MKITSGLVLALACCSAAYALSAPRPAGTAVLVVPARYSVLQVAFDVSDRTGAALVAYQGDSKTQVPVVDYWAGQEWKRLSLTEYEQASFVRGRVSRFIVVGTDEILPPVLVTSVSRWCGDVRQITALDTPGLVNGLGKAFQFTPSDWEWFAKRYNLQLADRNAERRGQSWYDRQEYDDEWAHRWQWLRRKYNPTTQRLPSTLEPVTWTSPNVIVPAEMEDARVAAPVPTIEKPSAAPSNQEGGPIERLGASLIDTSAHEAGEEEIDMAEPVSDPSLQDGQENASEQAPESEEKTWLLK